MATKISLDETRIDQFDIESVLSYANNFIANLGRQWMDLSTSHLRFQKMVFPEGISYTRGKGFGTARLGLIYQLNQTCGDDKSSLVSLYSEARTFLKKTFEKSFRSAPLSARKL